MPYISKGSPIAIIGAGIGGLALAISLLQKGYRNLRVFQKDESFHSRRQGYGLTILQSKGVLKELGVLEQAKQSNSHTKAHYFFNQEGKMLGFYGTIFWDSEKANRSIRWKQKGLSMHLPRQQLRKILLDKFEQVSGDQKLLHWNSRLQDMHFTEKQVTLTFNQTQQYSAEFVVGCDGIHSRLRELAVPGDQPLNFLGVMIILGLCNSNHPLTQQRIFQSSNGQGRFYCMPFSKEQSQNSSMWQFSIPMQRQAIKTFQEQPERVKQFLFDYCKSWHQPVPQLINSTSIGSIMTLAAFDRQPVPIQLIDDRIVLLGDASHPMSPFKSQGANQALIDAINLASALQKHSNIKQMVVSFNRQQLERTSKKVYLSRQRVHKYHSPLYLSEQSYVYPKIDLDLIHLLQKQSINFDTAANPQQIIIDVMKRHQYLK